MKQRIGVLVFFFLCLSLISQAQAPTAIVNGQVRDTSGAAIANASVEIINDATNVRYTTETNDEGIYSVPNLPPGTYHIRVSKEGFKAIVHPDITLNIQDARAIGFTLPVGPISDTVTVEGGAPLINTESAAVSTVVDQTYVKNMPLNGRSFQDLILLTPGAVTQTPQADFSGAGGLGKTGEFSINGQRLESNYYTVDGVSANVGAAAGNGMTQVAGASGSLPGATALGTTQALVSVDDLQEFRVQSSTYSAEYGRNPGGQFAFETKSGTNQWHGTAYDYLRNSYFDANDWFNDYFGEKGAALRQNDFGGTLGGPIKIPGLYNGKDKTFFFVSYEGLRLVAPQAATPGEVPDLCMRGTGACPSGRNPAAAALLPVVNAFPLPSPNGLEDATNGVGQFIGTWSNPSSLDSTSVRLDHAVNDRLRIFFRFGDTSSSSSKRGASGAASTIGTSHYILRTYTAGASSVFSSRLTNDIRLNYSSNETTSNSVIDAFGGSTPVDLLKVSGLGTTADVPISFFIDGFFQLEQGVQSGTQRQWNVVDAVSFSAGRHQLKFGVDYRRLAPFAVPNSASVPYFFFNESQVESNGPGTFPTTQAPAYPLYTNFSGFARDEWRVTPRLNLSLGLRWEVNPAPGVTQGLKPYTVQGSGPSTWTLAPQGTPLWQTTWYNFAPRLGMVYILRNAHGYETVVRAGGGVFFDTGQQLGSTGFFGPGFVATASSFQFTSFPIATSSLPLIQNPPVAPYNQVSAFTRHLQLPYTLQWSTSIEQALGQSQSLTISYVGSHATKLLRNNIFQPTNNPISQFFFFVDNGLTSDYDSLQFQFRRRLSSGLTALGSYTWSHCLDYGSQDYVFGYQRGNCNFDIRHNASVAFSYDLPNLAHNSFAAAVLHHWGVDDRFTGRTGFPLTLGPFPTALRPDGENFDPGLNLVPGQPIYLYGANCGSVLQGLGELKPGQGCPGGRAINPNAFALPPAGQMGDAPRNFARGFGAWQMDMAVRRDFPIHERLKLQFRAEAFNIFNHPNFGNIDRSFGSTTFGQATGTLANSLGILSPLYQMGGPRSMQFALKVVF